MSNITILDTSINQRFIFQLLKPTAIAAIFALSTGCATRAPSTREMDRNSVFTPALNGNEASVKPASVGIMSSVGKQPSQPQRTAPWIERVWIHDHELSSNTYFQGTYVFLEVQPSYWNDTQLVNP